MFCSGPTKKYKEWHKRQDMLLRDLGRSHRSDLWIKKIKNIYELIRNALQIPQDYKIGFVNGSATGAIDAVLWNLLGHRPCTVLKTGVFSNRWAQEVFTKIKVPGKSIVYHDGLSHKDIDLIYDFVFTMVETTNGMRWFDENILSKIGGLKICDATSAVFCEQINWELIDCAAFSFQKALGAEAGIGCIVINDKTLKNIDHKFPIPRFLEINDNIFDAKLNNTPSLIVLNDIMINLTIFLEEGGLSHAIEKCRVNQINMMSTFNNLFEKKSDANAVLCMDFKNTILQREYYESDEKKFRFIQDLSRQCESYGIFDICGHPEDKPCFRFWTGPTLEWVEMQTYINNFIDIIKYAI